MLKIVIVRKNINFFSLKISFRAELVLKEGGSFRMWNIKLCFTCSKRR